MEYKRLVQIAKRREFVLWPFSGLIEKLFFDKEKKEVFAYSMFTRGHVIRQGRKNYPCRYITEREFRVWKKLPWPTHIPTQFGFRKGAPKPPSP